jgi:hypothetical protein
MAMKTLLFILVTAGGATSALAQDSLSAQLTSCLEIPGVLQRLACYDRVAHSLPQTSGARKPGVDAGRAVLRATPPLASTVPPVVAAPPATGLGSERLPQSASLARRAQEMTSGVTDISYDARGRFTVTLENGQVWRQLEGDSNVLQASRISRVRISRGALGSYDLNVIGRNASYRVVRLQ